MRVDLIGKRVHARAQQHLLVLFEVGFDADGIPDLDGRGHGNHGREHLRHPSPALVGDKQEQPFSVQRRSQRQLAQFQSHAPGQRQHLPVPLQFPAPPPAPQVARHAKKRKRPEVPHRFRIGHGLADHSAEQPGEHGDGHGEPFVVEKCR